LRASSAVRRLWEKVRESARKECKVPLLLVYDKGKPGGLIIVHENDLATVASELAAGRASPQPSPMNSDEITPSMG
jgi:hypothetical protein